MDRKKKKILNLYAGIGGNRKYWNDEDFEITAVENNQATADFYREQFPNDIVIVGDAHAFLLENYMNYDFIWSSPPCPSHSDIRRCGVHGGKYKALYPDMMLYQEIILLQYFLPKGAKFVVENVVPYYDTLIPETKRLHRHLFWSNFPISNFENITKRTHNKIKGKTGAYGFDIMHTKISDKRKALRNMVDPNLGQHILNCAMGAFVKEDLKQISMHDFAEFASA